MSPRRLALSLLFSSALAAPALAGTSFSPGVSPTANVRVQVDSWLESCPQYGMIPLKVRIHNGEKKAYTWTVQVTNSYNGNGMLTELPVTVEPEKAVSMDVYAPVNVPSDRGYYYGSVNVTVSGQGITNSHAGNIHANSGGYRGNSTEFIAMGNKLSSKGWSALRDKVKDGKGSSSGGELVGSEVDMTAAPEDWRGYSGVAQLWLDAGEWLSLNENAKGAIMDWVATGGRLFVLNSGAVGPDVRDVFPSVPGEVESVGKLRHGAGELETFAWDGRTFPLQAVYQRVSKASDVSLGQRLDDYDGKWQLKDKVGELTLRSGLIFGFILVFGLFVGPLNLFWLAGSRRRHRLFWTTPLLSLGGSALLVGLMIMQDGTGGSGARLMLVTLLPEQKKLTVTQEQVSRTGVLLGGSFPVTEPGWMLPLDLDNESSGSYNSSGRGASTFMENSTQRWGDWFSSRSVQGHLIRSVRPSRASVELFPDAADPAAPPSVISSVEVPLARLFVIDEQERYWVGEDVGTGEKKVLRAATKNDYNAWLRTRVQDLAGPVIQQSVNELKGRPGSIYAEAADPSRLAVPTLTSIRWNDNVAFISGRYVKRS